MSSILLTAKDLEFELAQRVLFKGVSFSVARGDRIGIVGRNGEGKTTLLKIIAGELEPSAGRVERLGNVYYIPQLESSLFESDETVAEFVAKQQAVWARVRASLNKLFASSKITPERELRTLSGGELAKLLLAIGDTKNPEVLLLDEPTNHLDVDGLEVLKKYLYDFNGACVVISHDPMFLDHVVKTTWKIENGEFSVFGGNYSFYKEQKRLAEEARERDLEAAKKSVKQARRAIEARETRVARAERAGRRAKMEPSRSKLGEHAAQQNSENSAGKLKKRQDKAMQERKRRVSELTQGKKKTTFINLSTDSIAKKMLLNVSGATLRIGDETLLTDISLRVEFGDRLVITGANGSGKSSLAKALVMPDGVAMLEGEVKRSSVLRAVYIDQKYQVVDPSKSLIENVMTANPQLSDEEVYRQLGQYLFFDQEPKKKAGVLSGGETARLSLAMATAQPIDLLILDEPTNNLDIETLEIIADALKEFSGAIMVISHNIHFLARLGIERAYNLSGKRLKTMKSSPSEQEDFYNEILGSAQR